MGRRPRSASRNGAVDIDGFVVVDKPTGCSSHDVVGQVRRALGTRRVGHGGTLDPGATGVLVIGVGRATRLLRYVSELSKSYVGEIVFGSTTTTLDDEGEVVECFDMVGLRQDDIVAAAVRFTGPISQVPPMVSAIKIGGTRLHQLARQGIEIERQPRDVVVSRFDLAPTDDPLVYNFAVDCSSGTYVRSLAHDLGAALRGGAHLRHLRRTSIGPFTEDGATKLGDLTTASVGPSRGLVSHLDQVEIGEDLLESIAHGTVFERRTIGAVGEGPWAVSGPEGELVAVYELWRNERCKPAVVLIDGAKGTDQGLVDSVGALAVDPTLAPQPAPSDTAGVGQEHSSHGPVTVPGYRLDAGVGR